MRAFDVLRAGAVLAFGATIFLACSSKDKDECAGDVTFDNFDCSPACKANYSACNLQQKNEFPISGTYTITDCTYDEASSENQKYIGGKCEGAITLCITGLRGSVEILSYQDVGPSGTATGSSFKVYGSSCMNCDPGSTTPQSFDVVGTDTVQGTNGCTTVVDVWFSCFGKLADGTWTCRKTSAVRSSTCGESGYVHSFGHYKKSGASCGGGTEPSGRATCGKMSPAPGDFCTTSTYLLCGNSKCCAPDKPYWCNSKCYPTAEDVYKAGCGTECLACGDAPTTTGTSPGDDAGTSSEGGTGAKANGSVCFSSSDCASGMCVKNLCSCDSAGHSVCPCKSSGSSCGDDPECCSLSCGINTDGVCD